MIAYRHGATVTGMATWGFLGALYICMVPFQAGCFLWDSPLGEFLWALEVLTEGAAAGRRTC